MVRPIRCHTSHWWMKHGSEFFFTFLYNISFFGSLIQGEVRENFAFSLWNFDFSSQQRFGIAKITSTKNFCNYFLAPVFQNSGFISDFVYYCWLTVPCLIGSTVCLDVGGGEWDFVWRAVGKGVSGWLLYAPGILWKPR